MHRMRYCCQTFKTLARKHFGRSAELGLLCFVKYIGRTSYNLRLRPYFRAKIAKASWYSLRDNTITFDSLEP